MKTWLLRNPFLLPVYVPTFLISFGKGMLGPILPLYVQSFDASYALVGLVLASQGLGTLLCDLPAGKLLNRLGQRRAMLAGLGLIAISYLAMSWAQSLIELFLYGLTAGVGGALWNISRHAYLAATAPVHQRGRAIATFGGIHRLGTIAGPVTGSLVALFGLRAPFAIFAGFVLVTVIFPLFFTGKGEGAAHTAQQTRPSNSYRAVLRSHGYVLLTAGGGQLCAQMIRAGRDIVIPLFGANVLGLDIQAIGWIMSIGNAVDMSMFFPAGIIMDRIGRKYTYVPCFAIQGIGMALIPFTTGFSTLLAAVILIGFGNGLGSGTMMTLGADLAPPHALGEFLSIWRLIGDAGQSGGPLVMGAVAEVLSLSPAIFVVAGIGLLAATVFTLFVPETLNRPAPQPSVQT